MDPMDYARSELPPMAVMAVTTLAALFVFALSLAALFVLRGRDLPPLPKVLWAALIVAMPFMGAIAFFVVAPTSEAGPSER